MTVSDTTNRTSAVADNSDGQEIPYTFPTTESGDLAVYKRLTSTGAETELTEGAEDGYTATYGSSGGTVTITSAIAATYEIHIVRTTPFTQTLDLEAGGSFSAENIESSLDKLTKLTTQLNDAKKRSLRAPESDAVATDLEIPNSVDRASKNLGFDSDGNPCVTDSSGTFELANAYYDDLITKSPWVDVRAFGGQAYPNDLGPALQDAIDSLGQQTGSTICDGGIVFIPEGKWAIKTEVTVYSNVTIIGAGAHATHIICNALSAGDWCFKTYKSANNVRFIGFSINGATSTTPAGGILIGNEAADSGSSPAYITVSDVRVSDIHTASGVGIQVSNVSHCLFDHVVVMGMHGLAGTGLLINADHLSTGEMAFNACKFGSPYSGTGSPNRTAMIIDTSTSGVATGQLTFTGCFWGGENYGLVIGEVAEESMIPRNINISGSMFESSSAESLLLIQNVRDLTIENCAFHGHTGGAPIGVHFDNSGMVYNVLLSNLSFNLDDASTCVQVDDDDSGTYTNVRIEGLYIQDTDPTKLDDASGYVKAAFGHSAQTFTDSDATPSVQGYHLFNTNTTAVTVTRFDDAYTGQEFTIVSKGNITFDTSSGTRLIGSSADIVTSAGDITTWVCETAGTTASVCRLKSYINISETKILCVDNEVLCVDNEVVKV